jgi:hypothetical protein
MYQNSRKPSLSPRFRSLGYRNHLKQIRNLSMLVAQRKMVSWQRFLHRKDVAAHSKDLVHPKVGQGRSAEQTRHLK